MRKHLHSVLYFVCSFFSVHYHNDWFVDTLRFTVRYAVEKTAAVIAGVVPVAQWKVVERLYAQRVRTMLSMNSADRRHPSMPEPVPC